MKVLFVVNDRSELPADIPGVDIVTARAYLTEKSYGESPATKVINLCRTHRYQSRGYYVSLLAAARGHEPLPDVRAIEDMRENLATVVCADLESEIQKALDAHAGPQFELDIHFGRDAAERNDALARALFGVLKMPLMRARFTRDAGKWRIE